MLRGHAIKEYLLDIFFPKRCLTCSFFYKTPKFDTFLCEECFEKLQTAEVSKRNRSDKKTIIFENKILLKKEDFVVEHLYHLNEPLKKLIHAWKYDFIDGTEYLDQLILERCDFDLGAFFSGAVLVPIPLHFRRLAERGFNQSEFIARVLASRYDLPVRKDVLQRERHTKQQALLTRKKRFSNTKNAFVIVGEKERIPKSICLIDDVYTTGATMKACAEVLHEAGCERVTGCVFAIGDG